MGAKHLTFLLCAAGCAGGPDQPDTVLGAPAPRLEAADPVDAPVARGEDQATRLERLSMEVETAPDPLKPAIQLAQELMTDGRHAEALAVVMKALERKPGDPHLLGGRAVLLRDLGRPGEAIAVLVELRRQRPVGEIEPSYLCELAELEWLSGRNPAARETLTALEQAHAGHPWLVQNARRVAALTNDVVKAVPPRPGPRDLLGLLRGSPDPQRRMSVYNVLRSAGPDVLQQATDIAERDPHPALRAVAINDARLEPEALGRLCLAGLRDPEAIVRRQAARRTKDLPPAAAVALLVPALVAESDPEAFAILHEELSQRQPGGPTLPIGAAADAEVRRTVAAAWQKQWAQ